MANVVDPLFLLQTIQRESKISFPMFGNFTIDPPSYFTVGGLDIYFYGVIIALGFLIAMFYCAHKAPKFGYTDEDVFDVVVWVIPAAIIGARLYFCAFKLDYYLAHPSEIILGIRDGGLAIYGGVILSILVIWLVCRRKKKSFLAMLDLLCLGLLIGQIMGRWGNFMNREAFGTETEIFCRMGLTDPSGNTIYVHPTFLYESLWNLIGFIFLVVFTNRGKRKYDGQNLLIYFFWYGIGRAWIEGLRTDSLYIGHTDIRVSQVLSMAMVLVSGALLLINLRREHPKEKLFVNQVKAKEEAADIKEE